MSVITSFRGGLIAAVSSLALLAAPAMAQTNTNTAPANTAAPGMTHPAAGATNPHHTDPLKMEDVSAIKGQDVYGPDNKKIGSIDAVLMKPSTRMVDRLVIASGGVLGVDSHDVALPISDFKWDSSQNAFRISQTTDQLKAMPTWHDQMSEAQTTTH